MTSTWQYHDNSDHPNSTSQGSGTHIISYSDVKDSGKIKTLTVGSGEPVVYYSWPMPDIASAREIASGFTTGSVKKLKGMMLTLPATAELMELTAQCLVTTQGFGSVEDRQWHISQLDYELNEQGFGVKMVLE
jgi:hypothetical protein